MTQNLDPQPTPFGRTVLEIADEGERSPIVPSNMGLKSSHAESLQAHLDGIADRNGDEVGFVAAVAGALGLDPERSSESRECMALAYSHAYNEMCPL